MATLNNQRVYPNGPNVSHLIFSGSMMPLSSHVYVVGSIYPSFLSDCWLSGYPHSSPLYPTNLVGGIPTPLKNHGVRQLG